MSTSEFDDVKTRVAILENRGKITNQDAPKKPTLRRQIENDDESGIGEDRPTLKRRETY